MPSFSPNPFVSLLNQIYRRLMACLLYAAAKCMMLFVSLFGIGGYKRSIVGTCVILAPPKQTEAILEGIAYLRDIDSEMFKRLTAERKYVLWYHKESRKGAYEIYSITDRYLVNGKEGVVISLVQSVLDRDMKDSVGRLRVKPYDATAELRDGRRQILEFMKRHSFSPELVAQYQKLADK
jgi:hypothetical protein